MPNLKYHHAPSSLLNPPHESSFMRLEGEGGGAGEGGEAEPAVAILRKSAQKSCARLRSI